MWPATEVRAGTPTLSRATPGVGDGCSVWVVLSVVEDAEAQPATLAWRMGSQMAITVATTGATMRPTNCIMRPQGERGQVLSPSVFQGTAVASFRVLREPRPALRRCFWSRDFT